MTISFTRGIDLQGQVSIITGGGVAIASSVARVLNACGSRVVLCDINLQAAEKMAAELGENGLAIACDITDEADAQRVVKETQARWGRIDTLVNNAGVLPISFDGVFSHDLESWQRAVDIHQRGTVNMCRMVGKVLVEQASGAVVNFSAISSVRSMGGETSYTMSKAAIESLTRTLAVQWGPCGVRVNCVSPGYIDAGMPTRITGASLLDVQDIPLRRKGSAEDIAHAVAFLASADWSGYISGVVIPVDGGALAF